MVPQLRKFVFATMLIVADSSLAQPGPSSINISGALFQANGQPVNDASVNFKIEIYDKGGSCLLYSESHLGEDLSNTKGGFSLQIGRGTSIVNNVDTGAPNALTSKVFENVGAVAGGWTGCASGTTLASGDERMIRVFYDAGSGLIAMNPDVPLTSSAYAMVAETLQGLRPADLVQVRDDMAIKLSQANLENIFSATNYPRLNALVNGSSTQYMVTNPSVAVGFNGQRVTNLADPTAAQDAATKNYTDSYIGGKSADVSGVGPAAGNGYTLIWDQAAQKWITGVATAIDNTKLPLAGGTMTGDLDMGGKNILGTGHITMSRQMVFYFGTFTNAQEATLVAGLTAAQEGASWYNSTTNEMKVWDGTSSFTQAYLTAGKLNAAWLPASVVTSSTAAAGDLTGTYPNPTIANDKITSVKVDSAGIGINRLIISDPTTGANLKFATCATNEVLRFEGANGWVCRDLSLIVTSPVTSVNGKTGLVVLNATDLGLGSAALQNVGVGAGEVPQLNAGGKIPAALLPAIGDANLTDVAGSKVTGNISGNAAGFSGSLAGDVTGTQGATVVGKIQGRTVANMAPNSNEVLMWNNTNSQWEPTAVPSALGTGYIVDGGNTRGAAISIGTNDNFAFSLRANGVDKLTVLPSGNAGIGTIGPAAPFEVYKSFSTGSMAPEVARFTAYDTRSAALRSVSINPAIDGVSSFGISWNTLATFALTPSSGTPALSILPNGNVGVGTTNPGSPLEVAGAIRTDSICDRTGSNCKTISGGWSGATAGGISTQVQYNNGGSLAGSANFAWDNTNVRLGIGTASPSSNLHLASSNNTTLRIDSGTGLASAIYQYNGATAGGGITLFPASDTRILSVVKSDLVNSNAPLTVLQNGSVGIGTTSPTSKLHVAGEIKVGNTGLVCNSSNESAMRYNSTTHLMEYCNGTSWTTVQGPTGATGATGAQGPQGPTGATGATGSAGPTDQGSLCGLWVQYVLVAYCKGYNPASSCPPGFSQAGGFTSADGTQLWTCARN